MTHLLPSLVSQDFVRDCCRGIESGCAWHVLDITEADMTDALHMFVLNVEE